MGSEFRGCWRAELDGKADRAGQGGGWVPENMTIFPDFCLWDMAFDEGGGPEHPRRRQRRSQECVSFLLRPTAYRNGNWGNVRSPGRSREGPGSPAPPTP